MPESLALISANFSGAERGRAIGTWSGFASITAAAGPVIGGFLAQHASWRWVFLINLPLALAVLAIALVRVPESRDEDAPQRLDVPGALLATLGLGAFIYGLIRAQGGTPTRLALAALAAGVALLAAFVAVERRARAPMMPLDLFRSRAFTAANVYTLFLYAALGGSLYFLPFVLIDVQGYTPTAAGAALLPFVAVQFALSRWSGGLVARIGARMPLVVGALLAGGAASSLFALPGIGGSYWTTLLPGRAAARDRRRVFRRAAHDDGVRRGRHRAERRRLGRQQRGLAHRRAARHRRVRHRAGGRLRPRLRRAHRAPSSQPGQRRASRTTTAAGSTPAPCRPTFPPPTAPAVGEAVREGYLAGFRAVMLGSVAVCVLAALVALRGHPPAPRERRARGAGVTRFVANGDVTLALESRGDGPRALLFAHGWISSRRMWYDVVERLDPARFTAHLLDFRGTGQSDRPADGHDLDGYASDLRAALAVVGPAVVVAHSMGGKVAQFVAATGAPRSSSWCWSRPARRAPRASSERHRALAEAAFGSRGRIERFQRGAMTRAVAPAVMERIVDDALVAQREHWFGWYDRGRDADFTDRVGRIAVPTVVVGGENDPLAQPSPAAPARGRAHPRRAVRQLARRRPQLAGRGARRDRRPDRALRLSASVCFPAYRWLVNRPRGGYVVGMTAVLDDLSANVSTGETPRRIFRERVARQRLEQVATLARRAQPPARGAV